MTTASSLAGAAIDILRKQLTVDQIDVALRSINAADLSKILIRFQAGDDSGLGYIFRMTIEESLQALVKRKSDRLIAEWDKD